MNANELEEQIKYLQDPRQSADYCRDYENGTVLEYLLTIRQQQADLKDADKYALELERLYEDAKAEIEALKDKLMLAKQSLEIVEGWIKK